MAVVINEFEVVDTPQPQTRGDGSDSAPAPAPAPLDAEDLRRQLALAAELTLRRVAH